MHDTLPEPTDTIGLISLKIGFANLEILGVCFLQGVRQSLFSGTYRKTPEVVEDVAGTPAPAAVAEGEEPR